MMSGDPSDIALKLLQDLVYRDRKRQMTPAVALELARKLAHLAGGDGRGVYTVDHDPEGDRVG